jgi:hypothetical protein
VDLLYLVEEAVVEGHLFLVVVVGVVVEVLLPWVAVELHYLRQPWVTMAL